MDWRKYRHENVYTCKKKPWFVLIGLHGSEKGEPQIHVEELGDQICFGL